MYTASSRETGRRLRRPSDLAREDRVTRRSRVATAIDLSWPQEFARSHEDRQALLVILGLPSLTPRRLLELAAERKTASSCLRAIKTGMAGSPLDRRHASSVDPVSVAARLEEIGGRLVAVHDSEYPLGLLDLVDPPAGLFVRGHALPELEPRVGMVGARNCSPSGEEIAGKLADALAKAGACVVSGGARGIDAAAHKAALRAGGPSVAVLGSGIDVPYPRENAGMLKDVAAIGCLVSEYPPGTKAEPFRFPARNRIIAGLSRAVVVVEGAGGSGSMITADHALDLGRDVFAVPGAVSNPLATIPLALIRDGAALIRGPADLLGDLGLHIGALFEDGGTGLTALGDPALEAVMSVLTVPAPPDALAASAGLPLPEVVSALVQLELMGLVREVGGRFERRATRP